MRTLLVVLTVIEVALFLGVVASYLYVIGRSLAQTSAYLGKVAFGVRAIESQTAVIGPSVVGINTQLTGIASALEGVATLAEDAAEHRG